MQQTINFWPLIGIAVIIIGFVIRFNPVLVVTIAGFVTGLAAHMPIADILEKLFWVCSYPEFNTDYPISFSHYWTTGKKRLKRTGTEIHCSYQNCYHWAFIDCLSVYTRNCCCLGFNQFRRTSTNGSPSAGANGRRRG
ncbi:Protein of unknown function [Xenorhabdus japonica]|uniref:DUF969 family protein n=1 Tax=Xenorhabdus japonica TaxID=53341 RepID=A0A1I4YKZ2_9GAMM|nr:Protein of unknown function [Xenorhabdus japonica]